MTTVIVYNLHPRLRIRDRREHDIVDIFSVFGNVTNIILSNGFALVTFEDYDDAINAIDTITDEYPSGNPLIVKLYKPNMLR